ncbi:MAG: hypothetical protein JW852_07905 [Spirochaetales bacterium]|nr:hypothetical protein [Spirochaetales bacterium]
MKDILFKTYQISGRKAPNRFAAQPMETNCAGPGGAAGDMAVNRYNALAEGNWGIVFLEATSVTESHVARSNGLVLSRKNLDGFKKLVDSFKSIDEKALLIVQLTHSGRLSGPPLTKVKAYEDEESDVPVLTEKELQEVLNRHLEAAGLAHEAGFDGVDVKTCHGYLGTELLRPLNQRKDTFGGPVENRARLISSVINAAVRNFPGFIVGTRMSVYEGMRGGCGTSGPGEILENLEDVKRIAGIFVEAGAHFLNISGGVPTHNARLLRPAKNEDFCRLSQFRYARQFKEWFPDTTIIGSTYTTGDGSSLDYARENISKGYTDFAGFGRQSLADTRFPGKIKDEREPIQWCTLCGRCSRLLAKDVNVYCESYHADNPYA